MLRVTYYSIQYLFTNLLQHYVFPYIFEATDKQVDNTAAKRR